MSAGKGILHSEKNDAFKIEADRPEEQVHFIQMWVPPHESGIKPGYEQSEIGDELLKGGLVPVASGMSKHKDASAIYIHNKYAALYAARLQPGQSINSRRRRTSTCSSRAVPSPSRAPVRCRLGTPSA